MPQEMTQEALDRIRKAGGSKDPAFIKRAEQAVRRNQNNKDGDPKANSGGGQEKKRDDKSGDKKS
ncbi:hypothetical protein CONLIGDRAFT_683770 [Coniochaeta ligniaria NRRL 30616]|uniref:Uncharacterized protein n=1 Tax=Coniochaeta ligniaria NRRL 30616 TaxID=1408157 RepID=A0A1J7IH77_9PEZI|nr:hypothetical protein CONLIGDRAFT_683770 [Coniochaeta ligniaria NRRL 30616]